MLTRLALATVLLGSTFAAATPADGTLDDFMNLSAIPTKAKKDEYVLSVNKLMLDKWIAEPDKNGVIFYAYKAVEPGAKTTSFTTPTGVNSAPNLLVIPIPKGGTAKVGDIVLTWWQSGSGLQRAIVTDAKDPKRPVVRYLGIAYDNPAKGGKDRNTPIGQMDEQLEADSFVRLDKPFQPGSTVVCSSDGNKHQIETVVNASGEFLLLSGFAGKLAQRSKSSCAAMPQKPKVKVGQEVQAKFAGSIAPARVTKIDPKIGRVFVKYVGMGDRETALAYGDVIAAIPDSI